MQKLIIVITLMMLGFSAKSQFISTSEAQQIKTKKIIIALKEYPKKADEDEKILIDSSNSMLIYAMKNYWTFNEVGDVMPISEAKKMVEKNSDTYCYVYIDLGVSKRMSNAQKDSYGNPVDKSFTPRELFSSSQERLGIYNSSLSMVVYLPYYEGAIKKSTAVYAVLQMNKLLSLLNDKSISGIMSSWSYIRKNGPKLKEKTLLIPREFISPKLTEEEIKENYPYSLEFCDLAKLESTILTKDPKYAVIYYIPTPIAGRILHRLFITNAEDGDIYGVSSGSGIDLGVFSIGDKTNRKYLINKSELKQIAKIVK